MLSSPALIEDGTVPQIVTVSHQARLRKYQCTRLSCLLFPIFD
jgi:hypothetical protein